MRDCHGGPRSLEDRFPGAWRRCRRHGRPAVAAAAEPDAQAARALPDRHEGPCRGASLGTRARQARPRRSADGAVLREPLRATRENRPGRCCGDLRSCRPALDALRAGEGGDTQALLMTHKAREFPVRQLTQAAVTPKSCFQHDAIRAQALILSPPPPDGITVPRRDRDNPNWAAVKSEIVTVGLDPLADRRRMRSRSMALKPGAQRSCAGSSDGPGCRRSSPSFRPAWWRWKPAAARVSGAATCPGSATMPGSSRRPA